MSAARWPASSSESPLPEAKKRHTEDADIGTLPRADDLQDEVEWSLWINEDFNSPTPSPSAAQMCKEYDSNDTAIVAGRADGPTSAVMPEMLCTSGKEDTSDALTTKRAIGTTDRGKPDIEYRLLLSIRSSDGDIDDDPDKGSIGIYYSKPLFWNDDDKYVTRYRMEQGEEKFNASAPASPITLPSTSPPPDPATMLTLQQIELLNSQLHGPPSDSESRASSTASSSSRSFSATPPPTPTTAYLHLQWGRWEFVCVCELLGRDSDPRNIRPVRLCWSFNDCLEDLQVYFERPEEAEESVVDDNGNRFLVGYIFWNAGIMNEESVKVYGKRVVDGFGSTKMSADEKKRISRPELKRLTEEWTGSAYTSEEEEEEEDEDEDEDEDEEDEDEEDEEADESQYGERCSIEKEVKNNNGRAVSAGTT